MSKLYLLSQDELVNNNAVSEAVVCAENEEDAKNCCVGETSESINAGGYIVLGVEEEWVHPTYVKVKCIGDAASEIEKGVILRAYNYRGSSD